MANDQNAEQTIESNLKILIIIHLAMLAGQVLFGIVVFSQNAQAKIYIKYTDDPFVYIVPIVVIAAFAASNLLYRQKTNNLLNKETLKEKLMGYQEASIIRFALLEGSSLFGIVAFMLTGNSLFLLISGLVAIYFFMIRPTRDKIQFDLNLTYQDEL